MQLSLKDPRPIEASDDARTAFAHRARHIVAVIRTLIRQSADDDLAAIDRTARLDDRVAAFTRTQLALLLNASEALELEDLIREEFLFQGLDENRISMTGSDIRLAPRVAEVLTLTIHELAANAVEHGALAHEGRVELTWDHRLDAGKVWVDFCWRETGFEIDASAFDQKQFGLTLICRQTAYELGGSVDLVLERQSLSFAISFPIDGKGPQDPST